MLRQRARCAAVLLVASIASGAGVRLAAGQQPRPPQPNKPAVNLSAIPVALVSVAADGIARPVGPSPTGVPSAIPEFSVPRAASKVFLVTTSGGSASVHFSLTLPAGVPATAFQWVQSNVSVPNAKGELRWNGCTTCPTSFTIGLSGASGTTTAIAQVNFKVVASTARPAITAISPNGGSEVEPRFEVRFGAGTFDPADSEAIATYADGLKYRLIPENFNSAAGTFAAVIPRLKAARNVDVVLRNTYGSSPSRGVQLPTQMLENGPAQFNCVNCSTVFGDASIKDEYSVKHSNSGFADLTGTDEIGIAPAFSGSTPCNQHDFIYKNARGRWIHDDGYSGDTDETGSVTVTAGPPVDQVLRAPNNKIRISWVLKPLKVNEWYQIMFGFVEVLGACPDRVVS